MIQWVYELAKRVQKLEEIFVATDDGRDSKSAFMLLVENLSLPTTNICQEAIN